MCIFFVPDTPLVEKQRKAISISFLQLYIDPRVCEWSLLSKEATENLSVYVLSEVNYHLKQHLFFKDTVILSNAGFF